MEREADEARSAAEELLRPLTQPERPAPPEQLSRSAQLEAELEAFLSPPEKGVEKRYFSFQMRLGKQARANEEWFKDTSSTVKAGYTYGVNFVDQLIWHENATSGILQAGPTVVNTADGRQMQVPYFLTDAAANLTAERSAATVTNPVFAQKVLDSYRVDGYMVATVELLRDSQVAVMQALQETAARALATKVANLLAVGTGSSQPQGLNPAATSGKTAASATTFSADELKDLMMSILPAYRRSASWLFGSAAYALLSKLKDDNGTYLWVPGLLEGMPDRLYGRPCYEEPDFPACTTGLKPVGFGDVGKFWVRNIGDVVFERSDEAAFTAFEVYFRFAQFIDSELIDPNAFKVLTLA